MAAPTYQAEFSIGLLGTVGNLLSQPMNFYRCSVCAAVIAEGNTGTVSRDLHTGFHTALDTAASNASSAVTTANAAKTAADSATTTANSAKTTAGTAATDAASAKTTASQAATTASGAVTAAGQAGSAAAAATDMANRAMTVSTDTSATLHQIDAIAKQAVDLAQASLPAAEVTLCPLCRVAVKTELLRTHLTYHYRRAHGDPVEFPTDFDPTTGDLAAVDPPMTVQGNLG